MKRIRLLITFLLKQYPAYLRKKPSIGRVLILPFLIVFLLFGKRVDDKTVLEKMST